MSETITFRQHENKEEEKNKTRGVEGRGGARTGGEMKKEEKKMKEEERVGRGKKSKQSFSLPPTFKCRGGGGRCLTFPWSSSEEIFKRPVKFSVNTLKDSKVTVASKTEF